MKSINTINYLSSKFTGRKAFDSNAPEAAPDCSTRKIKLAAVNASLLMFLFLSLMAGQAQAANFTVNLATDVVDANVGDGVCDSNLVVAGGQCTLRAAIQEANFGVSFDTITIPANITAINLTLGELHISNNVSIASGGGARNTVVQRAAGASNFRIFYINSPNSVSVTIAGITIANGNLVGGASGAGISQQGADCELYLNAVIVKGNTSDGSGGGIFNKGVLNITNSTVSHNTGLQGGGINNQSSYVVKISNTTVSDNTATNNDIGNTPGVGGGIYSSSAITFNNVTISNNTASSSGGGFHNSAPDTNIRNTIIAGNTILAANPALNGTDVHGTAAISRGNNLIGISDGNDGFVNGAGGDQVGTFAAPINAKLGALQDNGGTTDTRALLAGSPALDAGNNCAADANCSFANPSQPLTTDQRGAGFARKVDGDLDTGVTVDIGAFEFKPAPITSADFTVNLTTDQPDANLNGICDVDAGSAGLQCSLRAAVQEANNLVGNDRVFFNLPANSTITLTTANGGEVLIANKGTLEINGTGAANLKISGGAGTNRIFFANGATAAISGVTLTGGNGTSAIFGNNSGGAIFGSGGALTLDRVHVTDNTSVTTAGGVYLSGGPHRIINSTISTNSSGGCGGLRIESGTLTVVNSTVSGNTATGGGSNYGGGLCSINSNATLRNLTVANNAANQDGGGIFQFANSGGTLNFGNTIVAKNKATNGSSADIRFASGAITSAGGNLVGNTSTFTPMTFHLSDKLNTDPMLDELQDNGGATWTHATSASSPAIDGGLNSLAVDPSASNAPLTSDQRGAGFARQLDGFGSGTTTVDIGAFEKSSGPTAAEVSVGGRVTTANGRGIRNVSVTLTFPSGEQRTVFSGASGYYSFTDVPAGAAYFFKVAAKRYRFSQPTQIRMVTDDVEDIDFIADAPHQTVTEEIAPQ